MVKSKGFVFFFIINQNNKIMVWNSGVVVALDAISSTVETVVDHSELIDDKRYISIDERKLKPVKRMSA